MLKRKMETVTIVTFVHFFLSICFGVAVVHHHAMMSGGIFEDKEYQALAAWSSFDLNVFYLFQPQFWLATVFQVEDIGISMDDPAYYSLAKFESVISKPLLISIPFWSICFGWLAAKVSSRLPYLSQKTAQHI